MSWHSFTPSNDPEWSPWHATELGYVDAPTHIQCRKCRKLLPAKPLFFRRKSKGLPFSTTCKRCSAQDPYRRSVNGQIVAIQNDPALPDAVKERMLAELPNRKREALSAARKRVVDAQFVEKWKIVRRAIVARKGMLANTIEASKHRVNAGKAASGIHMAMQHSHAVADYIEALRSVYGCIIDRMRRLGDWHKTIGDHYPPTYWAAAIKEIGQAIARGDKTLPRSAVLTINPWVLTTKTERARVRDADPERHDPPDTYWHHVLTAREASKRLHVHVYPWRYPEGDLGPAEQTPDWLRAFNGYDKDRREAP